MKVRLANKFDLPYYMQLIQSVFESDLCNGMQHFKLNDDYLNSLFISIINGAGIAYIINENEKNIGMTIGIISPNIWCPEALFLHQILCYIEPEYRNTRAGHMLISKYNESAEKLYEDKRIHFYTITAGEKMFDINFERFGYKLSEKIWLAGEANGTSH